MRSSDLFPTRRGLVAILAGSVTAGLLSFGYHGLDDLARDLHGRGGVRFVEEMTSALAAAALIPFVVWFVRRWPMTRAALVRRLPAYAAAALAWSGLLTTLRWATRCMLTPVLGLGSYNYGIMAWRYAMELPNDVLVFTVIAVFTYLFDEYRESKDREVRTAQLETRLAQAQLQTLRLQLQPHFLFNTLNTISSVVYEDPRRADEMIARLSDLLRATLRASNRQEVTLDEELAYLDLYVEIMRARFDERLVVSFDVDPGAREALVPYLVLQPLVENAIKHGFGTDHGATIDVAAHRNGDGLALVVRDRGPGLSIDPSIALERGVGLSNTVERLERLYGDHHRFALRQADGGGLSVDIRIPFHTALAG